MVDIDRHEPKIIVEHINFKAIKKSVVLLLMIASLFFFDNCNNDCKDDCGSCETFDPETCECIVDINCRCMNGEMDGDEEYIDCGGSCPDCACEYDPCTYLTGGDQKVWRYVETVDEDGEIYEPEQCDIEWTYDFMVEHLVEMGCPPDFYDVLRWRFDDAEDPSEIIFNDAIGYEYRSIVVKLTADTLVIIEPIGISTYVPKTE
jgi:hypothetical protein